VINLITIRFIGNLRTFTWMLAAIIPLPRTFSRHSGKSMYDLSKLSHLRLVRRTYSRDSPIKRIPIHRSSFIAAIDLNALNNIILCKPNIIQIWLP